MVKNSIKETKKSAVTFDAGRLAEQVRLAIGERSLSSYAEAAGVSKSYVSKIINQKLTSESPPSRKVLMKMAEAAPQNGVTLYDLFSSCGYDTEELMTKKISDEPEWMGLLTSTIQQYYNVSMPMTAPCVLMNALSLNGAETQMNVVTRGSYFEITTPENGNTYIGIQAFVQNRAAFLLMYKTVLATLLVLADRDATFYVLTDNQEFYQILTEDLKVAKGMKVAILLTTDHMFVAEEKKIGDSEAEWNPVTVTTEPDYLLQTSTQDKTLA